MSEAEPRVGEAREYKPFTYGEANRALVAMTMNIRKAEKESDKANEDAATAEAIYRKALGERFKALRAEGAAVDAAMTQARGELYNLSRERDIAARGYTLALERLEDRRGERASLHKLVDWSGGIDVIERRNPNGGAPYASDS